MSEIKPESGRCDFCQVNEPKHTINGGLWWVCTPCMNEHYPVVDAIQKGIIIPNGGEEE